jgi:AcrR family transcriptional regulator
MTDQKPQDESVASAARALADATAALTRLLGQQMGAVSDDVGHAVAVGLREASRGLETASDSLGSAGRTADRRRERAEETRTELLDAAARVVARRGYEGASVGDLAGEAGYTKGALYSNFGSKEDLFLALAARELAAGRVAPSPGAPGPEADQALLGLEILAFMARSASARSALHGPLSQALQVAAATDGEPPTEAALDDAVRRLAVALVGPLVERADGSAAGVTARLLARGA